MRDGNAHHCALCAFIAKSVILYKLVTVILINRCLTTGHVEDRLLLLHSCRSAMWFLLSIVRLHSLERRRVFSVSDALPFCCRVEALYKATVCCKAATLSTEDGASAQQSAFQVPDRQAILYLQAISMALLLQHPAAMGLAARDRNKLLGACHSARRHRRWTISACCVHCGRVVSCSHQKHLSKKLLRCGTHKPCHPLACPGYIWEGFLLYHFIRKTKKTLLPL